jgi:DtxR family transcriptional regulator, Mn-dependent transcriptional regulator
MLSPSLEDYLEEVYRFSSQKGFVRMTDIAVKLGVSLPSVNKAVQKLSRKGYLIYHKYRDIELTDKGSILGKFLVKRNRTLINFLEIIDSTCDKEQEAEAMEHYLSRETVNAITALVEFFRQRKDCQEEFFALKKVRDHSGNGL